MTTRPFPLAAILGLVAGMNPGVDVYAGMRRYTPIEKRKPAEKDAEALRKAQAKRDMKNAKRIGATKG